MVVVAVPVASEQRRILPIDDVVLEREAEVVFGSGSDDLGVSGEGEDVVADGVGFPIVLVEPTAVGTEHHVLLDQLVRAAFVRIDAPAAVAEAVDVVDSVRDQLGTRLNAEGLDATHVAEHALTNVRDLVPLNHIVMGLALAVSPCPAN